MSKDVLLIQTNMLLSKQTLKNIHDDFTEQLKSGVVIIPPYFDAKILNAPDNLEVIIQAKEKKDD